MRFTRKVHVRYPRKQTCAVQLGMSALGQKRTSGAIQSPRRRHSINCTSIGRAPPNRRENLVLHNAGAICLLCGVATAGGTPYASASNGGSWVPRMCLCTDVRHPSEWGARTTGMTLSSPRCPLLLRKWTCAVQTAKAEKRHVGAMSALPPKSGSFVCQNLRFANELQRSSQG